MGKFVETRDHPTEMLDLVDESFDQMALSILPVIVVSFGFRTLVRGMTAIAPFSVI